MIFKLRVIQALHGDCLILEYGSHTDRNYMLIDGGPSSVYENHLKGELTGIRELGGKLDLAILSHIDDDHINGLLDLLHELIQQRREGEQETIAIGGLWHNSFGQTLGETVERGLARQMEASWIKRGSMPLVDIQARSIKQGHDLTASARGLRIPVNVEFRDTPDRLVCLENLDKPIQLANLKIRVVGPTHGTLKSLQVEWEKWLAKQKKAAELPAAEAEIVSRDLDKSVPNLSSIMLLVEGEDKTVLLTGDGRGDHLLEGLQQAKILKEDGTIHVNVFKLPHHGSARNVTPELFEHVTADMYVICADGTNDNPDFQTLEWLVQAAITQRRSFIIVATNETVSTKALVEKYNPSRYSYKLMSIWPDKNSLTLDLSN